MTSPSSMGVTSPIASTRLPMAIHARRISSSTSAGMPWRTNQAYVSSIRVRSAAHIRSAAAISGRCITTSAPASRNVPAMPMWSGWRCVTKTRRRPAKAIPAAALRIFRQKGYHAASMRDIAEAVGLYKGSLYYYISSKEELLVRLFEGRAEQVLGEIDGVASGPGTASERLRAVVRAYVLGVLKNLDSVHVYLREEQALPPAALKKVHVEQRAMRDHFERVIGEGMRQGEFVGGDQKLAALALLGMCTWVHRWYG